MRSEISGLNEFQKSDDEAPEDSEPEDSEDVGPFISIPGTRDLGLGKPLALAFARECLPDEFDEIDYIFGGRGAYRNFEALLQRKRALTLV